MRKLTLVDSFLAKGHNGLGHRGDLLGELQGLRQQLGLGKDLADQSSFLCLGSLELVASEAPLHGLGLSNGASEPLGSSRSWDGAQPDLGLAKDGRLAGVNDVTHHGELTASTKLPGEEEGESSQRKMKETEKDEEILQHSH